MSALNSDAMAALTPVVEALRRLGVPFHVGGSLASSAFGVARLTVDADIVADLRPEQAKPLVDALEGEYYIELTAVQDAIGRKSSFNVIFLPRMYKVDVFVLKVERFEQETMRRARLVRLIPHDSASELPVSSAEDIILHKLRWYRMGQEVSERQWLDVVNVMKVQAGRLDDAYLDRWAAELGLADLLTRARAAAK